MNDTPITDAEAYDYETGMRWLDGVVSAHIVRKLERENAALRADKERLDWLESAAKDLICTRDDRGITIGVASNFQNYATNAATLRAAIDAARNERP